MKEPSIKIIRTHTNQQPSVKLFRPVAFNSNKLLTKDKQADSRSHTKKIALVCKLMSPWKSLNIKRFCAAAGLSITELANSIYSIYACTHASERAQQVIQTLSYNHVVLRHATPTLLIKRFGSALTLPSILFKPSHPNPLYVYGHY